MKLAIMQPYFFPYIGYFQLIHAVDAFVIYDDVNFIKGGWLSRNYILSQGEKTRITLQLRGASSNTLINRVCVGGNRSKLLKSIQQSYSRAPQFGVVMPLVEKVLMHEEENLAKYLEYGLREVCGFLGLSPQWFVSSDLQKDNTLCGQEKVLSICLALSANSYINASGGRELYDRESFIAQGIQLSFIFPRPEVYHQFSTKFEPYLSIIDVMMFNDREQCSKLLREYEIV